MNKSDTIGELAAALSKAQGQMTFASKDATNPHFKSKYADLAAVIDAVRKPLTDNGLSFTQVCDFTEDKGLVIETVLMHTSGEWISGRMYMPCPQMTPQGIGSATSYGKRYSLSAIVGIAADDDDDGEAAMGRGNQGQQRGQQRAQQGAKPAAQGANEPQREQPQGDGELLTEGQRKMIFAKIKAMGADEGAVKERFKIASINDLPKAKVNEALKFIEGK